MFNIRKCLLIFVAFGYETYEIVLNFTIAVIRSNEAKNVKYGTKIASGL